jgi:large subunit ribosomal protein L30
MLVGRGKQATERNWKGVTAMPTVKTAKTSKAAKVAKKSLRITQVKSSIGFAHDQGATLRALGLGKIGRSVEQVDNPAVRGMVFKVKHLVKVEDI